MSEYTTITDHPFPIVREIALSNYKRGQIIRLLQNVKAEVILSDTLALGDLNILVRNERRKDSSC